MRRLLLAAATLALLATGLPGARAAALYEKDVNLDEGLRLAAILRAQGYEVRLTRDRDVFVSLTDRSNISNASGPHAFVSVHNNSSTDPSARGTEVWAQVGRAGAIANGQAILAGVTARAGTVARGVFQRSNSTGGDYYAVLRNTWADAVIVEGAFMSNAIDVRNLATADFRQKVAQGIADGLFARVVATPKPTGPGPGAAARPLLPAPAVSAQRLSLGKNRVSWLTTGGVSRYAVWRDGYKLGEVATDPLGAPRTITVDDGVVPGLHHYEVRAYADAAGQLAADSPVGAADVLNPWRVVIDPGHGGSDPGAVGSI
jgi:N-acetylmuramoyl-L-alanine amidase